MCLQNYKFVILDGGYLCHSFEKPDIVWTFNDFEVYRRALRSTMFSYSSVVFTLRLKYHTNNSTDNVGSKKRCHVLYNFHISKNKTKMLSGLKHDSNTTLLTVTTLSPYS